MASQPANPTLTQVVPDCQSPPGTPPDTVEPLHQETKGAAPSRAPAHQAGPAAQRLPARRQCLWRGRSTSMSLLQENGVRGNGAGGGGVFCEHQANISGAVPDLAHSCSLGANAVRLIGGTQRLRRPAPPLTAMCSGAGRPVLTPSSYAQRLPSWNELSSQVQPLLCWGPHDQRVGLRGGEWSGPAQRGPS